MQIFLNSRCLVLAGGTFRVKVCAILQRSDSPAVLICSSPRPFPLVWFLVVGLLEIVFSVLYLFAYNSNRSAFLLYGLGYLLTLLLHSFCHLVTCNSLTYSPGPSSFNHPVHHAPNSFFHHTFVVKQPGTVGKPWSLRARLSWVGNLCIWMRYSGQVS